MLWGGVRGPQKKETGAIVGKWVAGAGPGFDLSALGPDLFSPALCARSLVVFSGALFVGLG